MRETMKRSLFPLCQRGLMRRYIPILFGLLLCTCIFAQVTPMYPIHATSNTKEFVVNDFEHLYLGDYSDGHVIVLQKNTAKSYIFDQSGNKTGEISLKPTLGVFIPQFCEGVAPGKLPDESPVLFSTTGKIVKDFSEQLGKSGMQETPKSFTDGLALIAEKTAVFQFINTKGEVIFPHIHMMLPEMFDYSVRPLVEGKRFYCSYPDRLFGVIDESGKVIVKPAFDAAFNYSEGLAAVGVLSGMQMTWGFIDSSGGYVIEPIFNSRPGDFHSGYSVVRKKDGKYVYINTKGEVCSDEYWYAYRFVDGKAIVSKDSRKFQVVDTSFQVIKEFEGPFEARYYSDDDSLILDSSNHRMYSPDGTLMYCNTGMFCDGLAWYNTYNANKRTGEKGYINRQGEIVLRFVESEF